jgi:hypothetical protein
MSDAAQGEPPKHVVFDRPFKVEPDFENWKTPGNYRRFPGGDKLPAKLKVWRIQETGKGYGGVVSRSWGFNDSPDAEVLTPGFNSGKESGAVGVGRHGNFLQWGFSAPPSKMTDAGRRFFLNCVCYIHRYDGQPPLVRRLKSDRINPIRLALLLKKIKKKSFFEAAFTSEQIKEYARNPKGLAKFYEDSYELIYWDKVYRIDAELRSLGIESNRTLRSLEQLIAMLSQEKTAAKARLLLERYTVETFESPEQWQEWLNGCRERIYFSDVGGYKFRVIPEGYLR